MSNAHYVFAAIFPPLGMPCGFEIDNSHTNGIQCSFEDDVYVGRRRFREEKDRQAGSTKGLMKESGAEIMRISVKSSYIWALLLSFSLISACGRNQGGTPQSEAAPHQPPPSLQTEPPPTDQEIADLKNEWVDPENGKKLSIEVQFQAFLPPDEERAKDRKSGTIPFVITGTLTETRKVAGKDVERQLTGDKVRICIRDKDGNFVLNTIEPLVKLCAS